MQGGLSLLFGAEGLREAGAGSPGAVTQASHSLLSRDGLRDFWVSWQNPYVEVKESRLALLIQTVSSACFCWSPAKAKQE